MIEPVKLSNCQHVFCLSCLNEVQMHAVLDKSCLASCVDDQVMKTLKRRGASLLYRPRCPMCKEIYSNVLERRRDGQRKKKDGRRMNPHEEAQARELRRAYLSKPK